MYTWFSETLGCEKEEDIVEGKIIGAEGCKAGEEGGRLAKTFAIITPTLSNAKGVDATRVVEEGAAIA